ncbi:MAG: SDR family oxidoreductase [Actinomycetia bacterium]|nr:SDR family oxidoreductase [Actinomycetes bacterium]
MRVVIAGGHGQIALLLGQKLVDRGDEVLGIIRNPGQVDDLQLIGVAPILLDLEAASVADIAEILRNSDAVVFAAGAGPNSGAPRKQTVDREAATKCAEAAVAAGVQRFLQVSAIGLDHLPTDDAIYSVYARAKAAAEQDLMRTSLDWVILRPGQLTNESEADAVQIARNVPRGQISRADVASELVGLLDRPDLKHRILESTAGSLTIANALDRLLPN